MLDLIEGGSILTDLSEGKMLVVTQIAKTQSSSSAG